MAEIIKISRQQELAAAKRLFLEYEKYLGTDLCFQNFKKELDELPGAYAGPDGGIWLARENEMHVGCIALKRHDKAASEIKRLFVQPEYHGKGIGKALLQTAIASSRRLKYATVKLDVLPKSHEAIRLYHSFGFIQASPYYKTDREVLFFELSLSYE
jgi:putative acetyltransferase